jgi:hypothetical protein
LSIIYLQVTEARLCLIHSKDKLIEIKLGGKIIKRCGYGLQEESVCLLDLQIDENLDWKVHINKVEKKISFYGGIQIKLQLVLKK